MEIFFLVILFFTVLLTLTAVGHVLSYLLDRFIEFWTTGE